MVRSNGNVPQRDSNEGESTVSLSLEGERWRRQQRAAPCGDAERADADRRAASGGLPELPPPVEGEGANRSRRRHLVARRTGERARVSYGFDVGAVTMICGGLVWLATYICASEVRTSAPVAIAITIVHVVSLLLVSAVAVVNASIRLARCCALPAISVAKPSTFAASSTPV